MFDFNNLSKTKQGIYNEFKLKFCGENSPLNTADCISKEDNLRNIFENNVNQLLRNLDFSKNFEIFKHETTNESGRTDCQYGNTIIEYKKYGLLDKTKELEKFQNQTQNYLKDSNFSGFLMYAFLFDGKSVYIYQKDENDIISFDNSNSGVLTAKNFDLMIKTIFMNGVCAISPENIKNDFGIIDINDKVNDNPEALNLAKYLFKIIQNTKNIRTNLIFKEWEKLFRLAESDDGKHQDIKIRRDCFSAIFEEIINNENEYKALFVLHTTISIIIKLLLMRIVNDRPEIQDFDKVKLDELYKTDKLIELQNFFNKIESGVFYKNIGVVNVVDNDFFSWYCKENFTNELKDILQKIIFKICAYENINLSKPSAMTDLFRELYLSFIPKCVRHSFGEYYTPYWLAERTFLCATNTDKDLDKKTYIDPNCGSGTFLSVFYNYKNLNKEKLDFGEFVKGVVGIDINPIAVLMARANVLIHGLKTCIFDITKKYEIPIYLADSIYTAKSIKLGNQEVYSYNLQTTALQSALGIDGITMQMPKSLVVKENLLEIFAKIEKHIVAQNEKKAIEEFAKYVDLKSNEELKQAIISNVKELMIFEKKGLNSIWLKIFSNYFKVASYDKFDYIIGNPAWIQWSCLPENYRNNIKRQIKDETLFSNDKNVGGNNLNVCALIAKRCIQRWLKDDGKFCYLMPKSILFNKSFEGFRKLIMDNGDKFYFSEILDFSNAGEVFEGVGLDFCAFKITKRQNDDVVPFLDYVKNGAIKAKHNNSWEQVKKLFQVKSKVALQLNTQINNNFMILADKEQAKEVEKYLGVCDYQFRKGVSVEFLMRLEFIQVDTNNDKLGIFYPYFKNGNRIKPNYAIKIKLELEYIKPYITAPMLTEQGVKFVNSYAICPYKVGTKKPMNYDDLKQKAPYIYKYLKSIEYEIGKGSNFNKRVQNFDEPYGILRMGNYVWGDNFVCIRDNTKLAPNHIQSILTHWGVKKTPLFDNHISYISEVGSNKLNEVEAKYIMTFLNNKIIQNIIMSSQDGRSISSRLPIKIPFFKCK